MTVPNVEVGRGAFRKTGKDNLKANYQLVPNLPRDGSSPTKDANYQAVNFGVKAIQARINSYDLGYAPHLTVDGIYDEQTVVAVKAAQEALGFTGTGVDGIAGPNTCRALWRDLFIWNGGKYHVPASHLYGFMMLESLGDPGALGQLTPSDRGLCQINEKAHPDVTDEMAFDPNYAIAFTAKRLGIARAEFSGKGVVLKNNVAIAQHNSPVAAQIWYRDEKPPLTPTLYNGKLWTFPDIEKYVNNVLLHAARFK